MATSICISNITRALVDIIHSSRAFSRSRRVFSSACASRSILNIGDSTTIHPKKQKPYDGVLIYPGPPSAAKRCKDPVAAVSASQVKLLDPTGARTRLFAKENPEAARVGDILLVRQRSGDPFSGICMNIRRRGVDTAILLRNHLTRIGVEMWYKIYSPNVEGIEVVQRRKKRARRARLYYLRTPRHDIGSVENIVSQYLRQRQALRAGSGVKGRGANADKRRAQLDKKNK